MKFIEQRRERALWDEFEEEFQEAFLRSRDNGVGTLHVFGRGLNAKRCILAGHKVKISATDIDADVTITNPTSSKAATNPKVMLSHANGIRSRALTP